MAKMKLNLMGTVEFLLGQLGLAFKPKRTSNVIGAAFPAQNLQKIRLLHEHALSAEGALFGHALLGATSTHSLGKSMLARAATSRGFDEFAVDLIDGLDPAYLVKYIPESVLSLVGHDDGKFLAVVDYCIKNQPILSTGSLLDFLAALLSLSSFERFADLSAAYEGQTKRAKGKDKLRLQSMQIWTMKREKEKQIVISNKSPKTHFALMSYKSPDAGSTNVGDYVQTVAMLGQILQAARGLPLVECYDASGATGLRNSVSKIANRLGFKNHRPDVVLHQFDRDDPSTSVFGGPLWIPVFGWFAHKKFGRSYDLNFSAHKNYRPLFISFHVNKPEILTDQTVAMLKKYEPIGCRDYQTARLILSHGVEAFFSGCVTSTIGEVFKNRTKMFGKRYITAHKKNSVDSFGRKFLGHSLPDVMVDNFDKSLNRAISYLDRFAKSGSIRTNLLHCYLPSRSIGAKVTFFRRNKMSDRRYEGLIGISDTDFMRMRSRFLNLRRIFERILEGDNEAQVRQLWKDTWQSEVLATREYLGLSGGQSSLGFYAGHSQSLGAAKAIERIIHKGKPSYGAGDMHVCFAVDRRMLVPLASTLRSLLKNTANPVHVHLLTRECTTESVVSFTKLPGVTSLTQYKFDNVNYGSLKLLSHTTVSTMDRLLLPECIPECAKILYLDVDILVRADIHGIWQIDLKGKALAARPSIQRDWRNGSTLSYDVAERFPPEKALELRNYVFRTGPVEFKCFNAGVLLLNLEKMREDHFSESAMRAASAFGFNDQFLLNMYSRSDFEVLGAEWNHFPTQELHDSPKLVHFIGPHKPWNSSSYRYAEEWRSIDGTEV